MLDTGAETSAFCNTNLFTTLERYETPEILVAANDTPIHVFGEGTFELEIEDKIYTINAVFTPLIDANLLSLDQIDELGLTARVPEPRTKKQRVSEPRP